MASRFKPNTMPHQSFKSQSIPCTFNPKCAKFFTSIAGLKSHVRTVHDGSFTSFDMQAHHSQPQPATSLPQPTANHSARDAHSPSLNHHGSEYDANPLGQNQPLPQEPEKPPLEREKQHPLINDGVYLPDRCASPPWDYLPSDGFTPFEHRSSFELADLIYRWEQMSAANINDLLQIWASMTHEATIEPPFSNANDLYKTIDAITVGEVPWQSFKVSYGGALPEGRDSEPWMTMEYEILQHQLGNPDFVNEIDLALKRVYDSNWSWQQADELAKNEDNHGTVFCPAILESDKTTVSVATGQNEYYPAYISNGLIHNNIRQAHRNGLALFAFLAIPKTDREHHDSADLRSAMEIPEVVCFGDRHFRHVIYGLGPYIGDYPEQVLLACIVSGWCAKCTAASNNLDGEGGRRQHSNTERLFQAMDARELWYNYGVIDDIMLLSPDLLHQLIKGTFKDHLVTWVEQYIKQVHTPQEAAKILADIDHRIAAVPAFPGLHQFPEGQGFKQWTGDDSKALMKVYLPTIAGHVPGQIVRALSAFLEFCYLVRQSVINKDGLVAIDKALDHFHLERQIFIHEGIQPDRFSLPRQHSMVHYRTLIQEFGAPNGLCSSITELKHIKAVKEPWRRSSRFNALSQMLTINQRLDKLAAIRVHFQAHSMLGDSLFTHPDDGTAPTMTADVPDDNNDDDQIIEGWKILGEVKLAWKYLKKCPHDIIQLSRYLKLPQLHSLVRQFLYEQEHEDLDIPLDDVPLDNCPEFEGWVYVYPSAMATYYAPSDISGIGGMHRERIRSTRSWRGGPARSDCVFVEANPDEPGFLLLFFTIQYHSLTIPCALVTWFSTFQDRPCEDTGMWMVEPDLDENGERVQAVIHIDSILHGAHLIGVAGETMIPQKFKHIDSLDSFYSYYINKYADHHAHEIAF
ncbi:hypothetical protein EV421DRAFT_1887139 [Armillaria borealis]|uniref:C2H2-type domain-containing protein n=1 Tax=Armillaria borealis TaxID=47425 RepID=A0AA39K4N1_9AGAR|nr:hypothetical protein EV421DRAFT_1887139 [Armillaria borealis]